VGTEEAFFCFVWPPFLTDGGGEGLRRDAETIVVSRERSKGSPKRKRRVSGPWVRHKVARYLGDIR
jgi:hypothetical protein